MDSFSTVIFYLLSFFSVYVQVFFLVTFLENRKSIVSRKEGVGLEEYPIVTIMVPCWNEEKTISKTVHSLLDLNYPKDKLKIILIDDGSTDNTWEVVKSFENYPNIKILKKENGGKHTALNLGLSYVDTNFVGCLDADSMADKESLIRIMKTFEENPKVMAVAPSLVVNSPKNIIQNAQKAEYHLGVFIKKMLGFLGAIHVAPGPLTIFRKKVFDDLGPYRRSHNTEDMEIAYRMQKNYYEIEQCNDAYVYTNTPDTVKKLYKQRARWVYGFINTSIDYRDVILKKKYGNFSMFTIPINILSIIGSLYLFCRAVYSFSKFIYNKIMIYSVEGFYFNVKSIGFDLFFINTQSITFISIVLYIFIIFSIVWGRRMVDGKLRFSLDMVYFSIIYSFIAPFWVMKAIINTVLARKPAWR